MASHADLMCMAGAHGTLPVEMRRGRLVGVNERSRMAYSHHEKEYLLADIAGILVVCKSMHK
jgi:hypothetical protein